MRCPVSINKTAVRDHVLSLVLSLSLIAPVAAATPAPLPGIQGAVVSDVSNIKIDNFGKVNANYYRGGQPKGRDFADLKAIGVKLVIDLAEEGDKSEAANVDAAGMKFVRIPLTTGNAPPQAAVDRFLKLVNDPADQPVYVHCMGGRHRTGALTAVYRMTEDGWTADQAFSEMKQYHFGADFLHPELKKFVYTYFSQVDRAPKVLVAAATPAVK
jgi:tyrosine-protein phosphatase SIW14